MTVTKHPTLLLFIGLACGQNTTSFSSNDDSDSDKLVQSFRSDMGKYYTITYSGEFLGQKNNKVYFKPINDVPLKLLQLKEIKELKQDNKVLIKNGKWEIEPESIKPYKGTFIDLEEVNTLDRPINKTRLTQVCCAMIIIFGLYTYLTFDNSSGGFSLDFNYNNADI